MKYILRIISAPFVLIMLTISAIHGTYKFVKYGGKMLVNQNEEQIDLKNLLERIERKLEQ